MKFKMSDNSLFAVLLRSSWWVSIGAAAVLALAARLIAPEWMAPYILSFTLPFLVIGVITGWKQLCRPSAKKVEATAEAVKAMSWKDFSVLLEQAFQRKGYTVARLDGKVADFRVSKDNRTTLISGKRWKAATHGVESLTELGTMCATEEGVHGALYVALGNISENALRFAQRHRIELMQEAELANLLQLSLPKESKKAS